MSADHSTAALSRKSLLIGTVAALVVGVGVVLVAVVPAEFGRDPTGLGKLTGLSRLWGPDEVEIDANDGEFQRAREYPGRYQTHTVEFRLEGADSTREGREIEYKVHMAEGAMMMFEWEVIGARNPDDMHYDFHGHTTPEAGEEMVVANYIKGFANSRQGSLVAPFEGIHGWFFSNGGLDPVSVRVTITGFYDLIPPGEEGNLENVEPITPPSTQAPA